MRGPGGATPAISPNDWEFSRSNGPGKIEVRARTRLKRRNRMASNVVRLPVAKHVVKDEVSRPYRLWNANDRRPERWRCYTSVENAHRGAILEMRWAPPGFHLEVYDVRTWRHLGTYTSRIKSGSDGATIVIEFTKGDGHVIVRASER